MSAPIRGMMFAVLVARDEQTWRQVWDSAAVAMPRPHVDFAREVAVLASRGSDGCERYESQIDSVVVWHTGTDTLAVFITELSNLGCADTTSRKVNAAAIRWFPEDGPLPVIVVRYPIGPVQVR